jgi:hypothetical protein
MFLEDFPLELLTLIFSNVEFREVVYLHTVCKHFDAFLIHNKEKVMQNAISWHPYKEKVVKDFLKNKNNNKVVSLLNQHFMINKNGEIVEFYNNSNIKDIINVGSITKSKFIGNDFVKLYKYRDYICALTLSGELFVNKNNEIYKYPINNIYEMYVGEFVIAKYFDGELTYIYNFIPGAELKSDPIQFDNNLNVKECVHLIYNGMCAVLTVEGDLYLSPVSFLFNVETKLIRQKVKHIKYCGHLKIFLVHREDDVVEIITFTEETYLLPNVKNMDNYPYIIGNSGELVHVLCSYLDKINPNILNDLVVMYENSNKVYESSIYSRCKVKGYSIIDVDTISKLALSSTNKLYAIKHIDDLKFTFDLVKEFEKEVCLLGRNFYMEKF